MAKKGQRKRRFRKYLRGNINHDSSLATLAGETMGSEVNADTLTEKAWLSSVVLKWTLSNFTPVVNVGPIMVGVAHPDYSSTEIEEWVENQQSWEETDMIGQEKARRKIREIGVFDTPADATQAVVLNDGKPIRTKCGWQLSTGQGLRMWTYNLGSAALQTTSPVVSIDGHCNLWPN